MSEEPKRRGRPPRIQQQADFEDTSLVDEAVVENFTPEELTDIAPALPVDAPIVESPADEESPVEQKIHQLVEQAKIPSVEGWENNMYDAPVDGRRIMVSENGKDRGALVYWRISKFVDKASLRYVPKGRWTDFLSKKDITFVPNYWKPYNPEEYWPLTV